MRKFLGMCLRFLPLFFPFIVILIIFLITKDYVLLIPLVFYPFSMLFAFIIWDNMSPSSKQKIINLFSKNKDSK